MVFTVICVLRYCFKNTIVVAYGHEEYISAYKYWKKYVMHHKQQWVSHFIVSLTFILTVFDVHYYADSAESQLLQAVWCVKTRLTHTLASRSDK